MITYTSKNPAGTISPDTPLELKFNKLVDITLNNGFTLLPQWFGDDEIHTELVKTNNGLQLTLSMYVCPDDNLMSIVYRYKHLSSGKQEVIWKGNQDTTLWEFKELLNKNIYDKLYN